MARAFNNNAANYLSQARKWADLDWFQAGASGSFHCWVKFNALGADQTIASQYPGTGSGGLLMRARTDSKLGIFYGGADLTGKEAVTTTSLTTGAWIPVGFSWDAATSTMLAYIGGVQDGSTTAARHAQATAGWRLGLRDNGNNPLNAALAEVSMWPNVVLSDAQFAALARGAPPYRVEPRALVHWPLQGAVAAEPGVAGSLDRPLSGRGRPWTANGTLALADHAPAAPGMRGGRELWTDLITEDGSSVANFTADSGSWSSSGGVITVTNAGAVRLRHNTVLAPPWLGEWESEVRLSSTGVVDLSRLGILQRWDGSGNGAPLGRLLWRTGSAERAELESDGVAAGAGVDFAFSLDTWYKMTVRHTQFVYELFIDDVFMTSTGLAANSPQTRVGLYVAAATGDFRNIVYRERTV